MDKTMEKYQNYTKRIKEIANGGKYSEYSFRSALEEFLRNNVNDTKIKVIHESGRELFGAPDFKIAGKKKIVGYIETKNLDVDLHKLPKRDKEQIDRYKDNIENLILTNYKEFILYQNGEKVDNVVLLDDDLNLINDSIEGFERLIERFLSLSTPTITEPSELADFLAKRTRLLRDAVLHHIDSNEKIKGIYEAFKKHLMKNMEVEEFADAYAQTIVYGLFMARFNIEGELTEEKVFFRGIPESLEVVREIFRQMANDIPKYLHWIIDELLTILNNIDVEKIKEKFRIGGKDDVFLHFYENFLASYNPELRKTKGVYYTPLPVVEFIVNSIDNILQDKFGKNLQDEEVKILDPATGTGTFLATVLEKIHKNMDHQLFQHYLKDRLLRNIYGFEVLISPYLVSHLKLNMLLHQWGIELDKNERFNIFLTNALNVISDPEKEGLFEKILDEEREEADKIKTKLNIFAVIGNPPYNVRSSDEWINELMKDYVYGLDVEKERSKKSLQDDYIKFIRFAQYKIEQSGKGVIGFITNNSYLDGVVHRRMRQNLMETFDEIYILDLHGNIRRGEKDENVFDIQQGVCIGIFVKLQGGKHKAEDCKVYYYSIVNDEGLTNRADKYHFLAHNTVRTIDWHQIQPTYKSYFFVPKELDLQEEYNGFLSLKQIFISDVSGIITNADKIAIAYTPDDIEHIINDFVNLPKNELMRKYNIKDRKDWNIERIIAFLKTDFNRMGENWEIVRKERIKPILYRPFDVRWTYFTDKSGSFLFRPRYDVMKHFVLGENIGLVVVRQTSSDFRHVLITDKIIDNSIISANSKEIGHVFPLYQYVNDPMTPNFQRVPNIKQDILDMIRQKYNANEQDFLYYIYAVLHDPKYREKYQEYLKIDFPRIPLYDKETFDKYKEIGQKLVELHLMKNIPFPNMNIMGNNYTVEKAEYDKEKKGAKINNDTILLGINEDVWNFRIGSYKVIAKYLDGRQGKELSVSELEHVYKIVYVIEETIKLMNKLKNIKTDK